MIYHGICVAALLRSNDDILQRSYLKQTIAQSYHIGIKTKEPLHTSTNKDKISIRLELLRVVACGAARMRLT